MSGGRAALRTWGLGRATSSLAALALAGVLAGCSALGGITGAVAGAASGSASGNPGVGIAVAIGIKTAVDAAMAKLDRHWQHEQQQAIAAQIGALPVGAEGPWQVRQIAPWEDEQGRVRVLRAFATPLAECKEALFSIEPQAAKEEATAADAGGTPPHFLTTVCRAPDQDWQWALAEPAVARWGTLH